MIGYKTIKKVISDLEHYKLSGINKILFVGPEINFNYLYLKRLCHALIKRKLNLRWSSYAIPKKLDYALLNKMYKSGCRILHFGVESGYQKRLDSLYKKTNVKEMESILSHCQQIGIRTHCLFIVGFPFETSKEFKKTVEFIVKNAYNIDFVDAIPFHAAYDSPLFNNPEKYNIKIIDKDALVFRNYQYEEIGGKRYAEIIKEQKKKRQIIKEICKIWSKALQPKRML